MVCLCRQSYRRKGENKKAEVANLPRAIRGLPAGCFCHMFSYWPDGHAVLSCGWKYRQLYDGLGGCRISQGLYSYVALPYYHPEIDLVPCKPFLCSLPWLSCTDKELSVWIPHNNLTLIPLEVMKKFRCQRWTSCHPWWAFEPEKYSLWLCGYFYLKTILCLPSLWQAFPCWVLSVSLIFSTHSARSLWHAVLTLDCFHHHNFH